MTRTAIYARTSTSSRQDIEGQLVLCRKAAGGGAIEFIDRARSGLREDRAGIEALLKAARDGKVARVYLSELSRIGRSIGFIHTTVEQLSDAGCQVILATSGMALDPKTLEGGALLGGLALAADIEMRLIKERNARGRDTMTRKGIKRGRKPKPVSDAVLRALSEKGLSQAKIAKEVGVSKATVNRRCKALQIRTEVRRVVPPQSGHE